MASSAFIDAVVASITQLVPEKTLIELTNQRKNEVRDELWDAGATYEQGAIVEHSNEVWVANTATTAGQEPGVHASWDEFVLTVDTAKLEHAIELAAAEVEPFLMRTGENDLSEEDPLAVGYAGQLTIHRLARTHNVSVNDLSIQTIESIMSSLARYQNIRARRAVKVVVKRKPTGMPNDPSGFDPFRNL